MWTLGFLLCWTLLAGGTPVQIGLQAAWTHTPLLQEAR
jgi:hypothetical protein